MRDIYKTAKKAQTTPVRGRVKAMMAQPRAVAQARKIARQTTGFKKGGLHKLNGSSLLKYDQIVAEEQEKAKKKAKKKLNGKQSGGMTGFARGGVIKKKKHKLGPHIYTGTGPTFPRPPKDIKKILKKQEGGTVKPMSHNSELTKWFLEQHGGTQKGKPHSTRKGRIAAGERALWRGVEEFERKRKKRRMGPGAPSKPRPKAGPPAGRPKAPGGGIPGLPRPKAGPPATREYQDPRDRFKKKKKKKKDYIKPGWKRGEDGLWVKEHPYEVKKGGVMEKGKPHSTKEGRITSTYRGALRSTNKMLELAHKLKNKDRLTQRDIERAEKLTKSFGKEEERPAFKEGKAKAKKHKEKLKKLAEKGIGYIQGWVGKKKGGKVKRGCANGGTVVMPTVGNDVRTRAYKHGALIHPRPRPTTVLHGRERARGVGIAKRGW